MATASQNKIAPDFYCRKDVLEIGRELLGKVLMTQIDGVLTGGIITETESYMGAEDKASHAYQNRRTPRTEVMFENGGVSYVYLCYGIHHLFNIVTSVEDVPHAVLVRAIEPTIGKNHMLKRRKQTKLTTTGPATVTQALGIKTHHSGISLMGDTIWLEDHHTPISKDKISESPRVGVDYAEEHALLPWRFQLKHGWNQ